MKSQIENKPKEQKQKRVKVSLAAGTTILRDEHFPYIVQYLQNAFDEFNKQHELGIKAEANDREVMLPYTVYGRFVKDYSKYDAQFNKQIKVGYVKILFDNITIGHFKRAEKIWTHISTIDKSIALEDVSLGSTVYGENYFITKSGMILHNSQFKSTFF